MSSESKLNKTVSDLPESGIRKIFDEADGVEGLIGLTVGEPDFPTPWHIRATAINAIEKGSTHYTLNRGTVGLRKAICAYTARRFGLEYAWQTQCLVTCGGSESLDLVFRTILEPGDEVILLEPCYVAYESIVRLAGGVPVYIHLKEEYQFKLTVEDLEQVITPKTKAILVNFPGNPTGGVMTKEEYADLVPLIEKHHLLVVSDEIYAELEYGQTFASLAMFPSIHDQVIVVNGFSKAYSMTGWRLGYTLARADIINAMLRIHQYTAMCPSTISQIAGEEAMNHGEDDIATHKASFESRRNFMVNGLNRIGLTCTMPEGAFYVFPNISCTHMTSEEFCSKLIKEAKVAVVPGNAFGPSGEGFVRISYAYSIEELKEALTRMEAFLEKNRK